MSTIGSLPELDPVIHAQARLRVMVALSALATGDQITFPRLQQLLEMSAGNLSTHLRKLEDAKYVQLTKAHQRRTPVTYPLAHPDRPARTGGVHPPHCVVC